MNPLYVSLSVLFAGCFSVLSVLNAKPFITLFQGCSYHNKPYLAWYFHDRNATVKTNTNVFFEALLGVFVLEVLQLGFIQSPNFYFAHVIWVFVWSVHLFSLLSKQQFKKPLQVTARIKRLMATLFLFHALLSFVIFSACFLTVSPFLFLGLTPLMFGGIWVPVCNALNAWLEKVIGAYYVLKAKKKLKQFKDLLVIGITGSFGKTSCKFLLTQMLQEQFSVLSTPKSYNTLMGICKTVLTELKPHHQIFIVEMGADHENDIKKLCRVITPTISLLTGIGDQHLQTFKTKEALINTKFQIMQCLKPNGLGVFNTENDTVKTLYDRFNGKKIAVSKESGYFASDVLMGEFGSCYVAHTPHGDIDIKTKLLGYHQITNVLLAMAVAHVIGVTNGAIEHALKIMPTIPSRLQLVRLPSGGLLLDDSFNSNPMGCKEALEVLAIFQREHKVVITPGMVELKNKQYVENFLFGKRLAQVANEVYVINYLNKEALYNGLRVGGFNFANVHFFETFDAAFAQISQNMDCQHIILIENDLPDQYL